MVVHRGYGQTPLIGGSMADYDYFNQRNVLERSYIHLLSRHVYSRRMDININDKGMKWRGH